MIGNPYFDTSTRFDQKTAVFLKLMAVFFEKMAIFFCSVLQAEEFRPYYTDKFAITSTSGCEQKISTFGLINMYEFNQNNERMMTILKNLMQIYRPEWISRWRKVDIKVYFRCLVYNLMAENMVKI